LVVDDRITPIDYRYHFQDENNKVIFRYDSTPHFPDLSTFPHHKHLTDTVIAADQPNITQCSKKQATLPTNNQLFGIRLGGSAASQEEAEPPE
jgi:hypothetical protein